MTEWEVYNRLGKCAGRSKVLMLELAFIYTRLRKETDNERLLSMVRTAMRDAKKIKTFSEVIV
jgi:hypothetical protein